MNLPPSEPIASDAPRKSREQIGVRRRRVIILGAAGRDFHNFNVAYRNDPAVEVIAFTAVQIPGIAGRRYPAVLAGPLYPTASTFTMKPSLRTCANGTL